MFFLVVRIAVFVFHEIGCVIASIFRLLIWTSILSWIRTKSGSRMFSQMKLEHTYSRAQSVKIFEIVWLE